MCVDRIDRSAFALAGQGADRGLNVTACGGIQSQAASGSIYETKPAAAPGPHGAEGIS